MKKTTGVNEMHYSESYCEESTYPDDWSWTSSADFNTESKQPRSKTFLSNVDYSLHSPLIIDELEAIHSYLQGRPYRAGWQLARWRPLREALKQIDYHAGRIQTPSNLHHWMGRFFRTFDPPNKLATRLLKKTQADAMITGEVVQSFLRGWTGRAPGIPDKSAQDSAVVRWCTLFLDTHFLTLVANSASKEETGLLRKKFRLTSLFPEDPNTACSMTTESFGRVLITKYFILLIDHGVLLDRNTLLMLKDIAIARFQTLSSMVNRTDDRFRAGQWRKMDELYRRGDVMLEKGGVKAYDGVKLLEPICSKRMAELAVETKPLFPAFENFDTHIRESVRAVSAYLPSVIPYSNLIMEEDQLRVLLNMYGSFRHWGHPYVDYKQGLVKLESQVNLKKTIDTAYAEVLASDLAYMVLRDQFRSKKKWFVDPSLVVPGHPLHDNVHQRTWPTPKKIMDFGDNWHRLPLVKCFDIPDVIDPSIIYSDKSHSMTLPEIIKYLKTGSNDPIPTRKVLETYLRVPATDWPKFLRMINDHGLTPEHLVIGLKAKEREIKIEGRFFSLMSWQLREYFVITEYLIKTHFVPLFHGLTMADDLTTVIKKMLDTTSGHGKDGYDFVSIANHFDYSKWNNHQRGAANNPVFKVMGQFLGYPNLITRTHEFFEKSLVYYLDRPDKLIVRGGVVHNRGHEKYCWQGQLGGLEGLRQKGWSIVNLLAINRASKRSNTLVKVLAQGDNQVVCTNYRLQSARDDEETRTHLARVWDNNDTLIREIERSALKLGLLINRDETLQSAEFLVYGKVPVYRGNFQCLESKRWSRVTCVTNDQLPTLANILSTVGSNALTVSHFSDSPVEAMFQYNYLGNFCRNVIEIHNPAIKGPISESHLGRRFKQTREYLVTALYLDPSIGGISGTSLTRFLVRGFPDPVTESLSFWKLIARDGGWLKDLACKVGSPKLGVVDNRSFGKLLEDPLSLNIPSGINPLTVIKEEIKKELLADIHRVKNNMIRVVLTFMSTEEDKFICYLRSIKPLFPRFLSEYRSSSFLGVASSLVGLFQNSKTIRTMFTRRMDGRIKEIIVQSETNALLHLSSFGDLGRTIPALWSCSATKADQLRLASWGSKVYGATIPHPIELINLVGLPAEVCNHCLEPPPTNVYVSILVPHGLTNYLETRGPYPAYLGSKTSESTSILQPWERESKVPLLKRAVKLRNAINWFVTPDSNLAKSILQNIGSLTAEVWDAGTQGFKRTGSALHRFSCSRQSAGGYTAQSPAKLTYMCATTDTMRELGSQNYDFMYQSLLLYAQMTSGELHDKNGRQGYYHFHVACRKCLREIDEINIDADVVFEHQDVSDIIKKMVPEQTELSVVRPTVEVREASWETLDPFSQSYHIGRAEGFLFGELLLSGNSHSEDSSLFPIGIRNKVMPRGYMGGLLNGLMRAGAIQCVGKRVVAEMGRPRDVLLGVTLYLIVEVMKSPGLLNIIRYETFEDLFRQVLHKVPPSYPLNDTDLGALGRNYLRWLLLSKRSSIDAPPASCRDVILFSDLNHYNIAAPLICSSKLTALMLRRSLNKSGKRILAVYKDLVHMIKDPDADPVPLKRIEGRIARVDHELRHACKFILKSPSEPQQERPVWGPELVVGVYACPVDYTSCEPYDSGITVPKLSQPRRQDPLISGIRLFQFATGSHYKVRSILHHLGHNIKDVLSGGDGSGGIGASVLRSSPFSRLIFNSLLDLSNVSLRGASPSPPSAIGEIKDVRDRCVNYYTSWEHPSDLSRAETWEYFLKLTVDNNLDVNLIILDMEVRDREMSDQIEKRLADYVFQIGSSDLVLIYKTYQTVLCDGHSVLLDDVGPQFLDVFRCQTEITSSGSSEVYVVMRGRRYDTNIRLYPCPESYQFKGDTYNFASLDDEFIRACKLTEKDMYQGVPASFRTNVFGDLIAFLTSLGVETGVAGLLCDVIPLVKPELQSIMPYIILITSLNSMLRLTFGYIDSPGPPTDSTVACVGVLTMSYMYWMSLCFRDVRLYKMCAYYMGVFFPFSWTIKSEKVGKGPPNRGNHRLFRHYSFLDRFPNTKNMHMDSKMSALGQGIRVLAQAFGYPSDIPTREQLNKGFKALGLNMNVETFNRRCDFMAILSMGSEPVKLSGSAIHPPADDPMDTEEGYQL